jgi:NADH-quinone oxidoreductase subunit M
MESYYVFWLSSIVFLPAVGALAVYLAGLFAPNAKPELYKMISLIFTILVFGITVWMAIDVPQGTDSSRFHIDVAGMQDAFALDWIPSFNIYYFMGVDGISFTLVLLTSFLSMLSMWASWPIQKHVKAYCILFLLLETGMLGVFLALDFFLFYVFWEVMLLPMYFLIGVWGGPRREYAAIKFFLYTLLGSVFMLIAILMLYFNSDLRLLDETQLQAAHVPQARIESVLTEMAAHPEPKTGAPVHTFNMLALAEMSRLENSPFNSGLNAEFLWGRSLEWWAFVLLFAGFVIKVPVVPVHTWLPDAHVEAPTPISMILAGVLLKMGGYGIIRICYPICPEAGYDLAYVVTGIGVLSMVYGAFAAMAQKDFKRLVAYSSVSHMGYVLLGIGVWSAWAGTEFNADYWKMGMNGAMFQMIAHGISSAGMFFLVGVIYDRVHHRNLDEFGGLFAKMPTYSGIAFVIFFAALGLPGLCGFIGEVFVTLSVWSYSQALAAISAAVVMLTAGYILWTLQRVYLGPEYKGPHEEDITPATPRELAIAAPLVAFAILLGVYPNAVFRYLSPSVDKTVNELAQWTADVKQPRIERERAATEPAAKMAAKTTLPRVND